MSMLRFEGHIHLITSNEQIRAFADDLKNVTHFGFDTETRPSFRKGEVYTVALLQLATETDAYLIRTHHVSDFQVIREVFESEGIVKVGVAIRDDIKQLRKVFDFEPRGFVELQEVAKKKGLQNLGLRGMTEEVLGGTLSKAAKITNWQAERLTPQQITYAATDAWVGLKIYESIINRTLHVE